MKEKSNEHGAHESEPMTYVEAKKVHDARKAAYESLAVRYGKAKAPGDFVPVEYLDVELPEGVYNYNTVSRCKGLMVCAENDKGVYEYPAGLMAWGGGIPESAYVSKEDLEKPIWRAVSRMEDYSDW